MLALLSLFVLLFPLIILFIYVKIILKNEIEIFNYLEILSIILLIFFEISFLLYLQYGYEETYFLIISQIAFLISLVSVSLAIIIRIINKIKKSKDK